jgi:hypothetical protein
MPYNSVSYIREAGGPGELEKHLADIQGSGLTTAIVGMLHIGNPEDHKDDPKAKTMKFGDFIYNNYPDDLIVRDGTFNPPNPDPDHDKAKANNEAIAKWPAQVAKLKQQGSVRDVFLVVGSPPRYWPDFKNIGTMLAQDGGAQLKKNLVALQDAFTINGRCVIDGFDIDCEEDLDDENIRDAVVRFCEMVFELGFKVTFCPYQSWYVSRWQACMQRLWDLKPSRRVSWWNLQCYDGGNGNLGDLSPWIDALGNVVGGDGAPYLVPGLCPKGEGDVPKSDERCPFGSGSFEEIAAGWKNPKLGGMFLWRYDPLALKENQGLCSGPNTLAEYVKAINSGLSKGARSIASHTRQH